jgi:hypothetical protein
MAYGPVDRRANRAEWARAGPGHEKPARAGPYGLARAGSARRGPGFWRWARRAEKKIQNFEIKCIETQNVCLKVI